MVKVLYESAHYLEELERERAALIKSTDGK
jgi:hypothetical protein